MSTLAEAKAELGHAQRQIDDHRQSCHQCKVVRRRGQPCAEKRALESRAKELRAQIKTWFAPSPDDATLFDD